MTRGFLLHSRPFRESSLIATFLTDSDGRQDLIVRSARSGRRRQSSSPLPFSLYELSWAGKGSLKNLQFFESLDATVPLTGQRLYCGLYLNELLYRLLSRHEPEPLLLQRYADALQALANSLDNDVEPVLRNFELNLLDVLGFGLDFSRDENGQDLSTGSSYVFMPEKGLHLAIQQERKSAIVGDAHSFQSITQRDFSNPDVRKLAKVVLRAALSVYLGGRPLRSRELFASTTKILR
jgi:DNA repair protein RecO (recombination protein O)